MNDTVKIRKNKLDVVYVFSKDNKVYLKQNKYSNTTDQQNHNNTEEWLPVHFQWVV
ncbi:hypothetical protein [Aquimarina algicola]|uniref:hypothetical protein n=1 Tax=Aquimarina algicola TaxID=2589995 RepID=UPI001CF5888F|nr:hypothetical protein [Aquimarina algicola]